MNIEKLTEQESFLLIEELKSLDKHIEKKVSYVIRESKVSIQVALEYVINETPQLWAKMHLNWTARDYQIPILEMGKKSKKTVLRLGRRLGKTECMCILILWHAFRQPNMKVDDSNATYNILILTPYETQIDLIFDRLNQLMDGSTSLSTSLSRRVHHRIELDNSTTIKGLTLGVGTGKEGSNTRGQRADLLIYDEVDYAGSKEITNTLNIANEDPGRIKIIASSTPCGKHEEFYRWCVNSSTTLRPKQDDIDNFRFTGYIKETNEKGNGWVQVYSPSNVNRTILEINPETNQTYLQDIKDELTALRFEQEVMAEFGDEELGVYSKRFLDQAYEKGHVRKHKYWEDYSDEEKTHFHITRYSKILVAAIDWDIVQATPNILCLCYDKNDKDENGNPNPIFKVLFRIDIPRTEFTLDLAVNTLIELDEEFNFDHVAIDRGMGEMQVETIKKYGTQHPETGLHLKTEGHHFGSKVDIVDPHTGKKVKVDFKPFMVDNSVRVFERGGIMLSEKDKILKRQLTAYRIKSFSQNGRPIFIDEDEHSVDTLNLALLTFAMKYSDIFKAVLKGVVLKVEMDRNPKQEFVDRTTSMIKTEEVMIPINNTQVVYVSVPKKKNPFSRNSGFSKNSPYKRSSF